MPAVPLIPSLLLRRVSVWRQKNYKIVAAVSHTSSSLPLSDTVLPLVPEIFCSFEATSEMCGGAVWVNAVRRYSSFPEPLYQATSRFLMQRLAVAVALLGSLLKPHAAPLPHHTAKLFHASGQLLVPVSVNNHGCLLSQPVLGVEVYPVVTPVVHLGCGSAPIVSTEQISKAWARCREKYNEQPHEAVILPLGTTWKILSAPAGQGYTKK